MNCPCGSPLDYQNCCEPFLTGKSHAPTPEALMRSRYTAHVKVAESYLRDTLAPEALSDYNEKKVRDWAKNSEWLGLEIIKVEDDTVEFNARYKSGEKEYEHHELAKFRKHKGRWVFVTGDSHVHEDGKGHEHARPAAAVRTGPKLGRNDPCHCGSGKKFKKCCGA